VSEHPDDRLRDEGGGSRPVRIAVDAMGGDHAPAVQVEGALSAVRELGGLEVVLVGRRDAIEAELRKHDGGRSAVSVVHADEVIEMDEVPANAVRKKRGASLVVAAELHKRGDVDGLVSAGNTGAVVASALLSLGKLPKVRRPAIASLFPTLRESGVLIDVGACVDSRPSDLLTFAAMGETYARSVLGRDDPRVALMNIGAESHKGSGLTQTAYGLLSESPLNFVGNIEGTTLLEGQADVVVCDGFVGNVMLKMIEGTIGMLKSMAHGDPASIGLGILSEQLDYAEHGGAPLLGIDGVVVIAHGGSSVKAIKNAVGVAARFVNVGLGGAIADRMREVVTANVR